MKFFAFVSTKFVIEVKALSIPSVIGENKKPENWSNRAADLKNEENRYLLSRFHPVNLVI